MPCFGTTGEIVETSRSAGELSFEWRIHHAKETLCGYGRQHKSPEFRVCDARWCFLIYTDTLCIGSTFPRTNAHLILRRKDTGPSKKVNIAFYIKDKEGSTREIERDFSIYHPTHHFNYLYDHSKLTAPECKFISDNILTISCNLKCEEPDSVKGGENSQKIEEQCEIQRMEQGLGELQQSLQRLLKSGQDSDCLLKVQGKEFPAHRLILQARSPVFRAMFGHDTAERRNNEVTMDDCDPEHFSDFLEHLYTGSVDMISTENVFSLFVSSDKYDLGALKRECSKFMRQNLAVATFCRTLALAIRHSDQDLVERATEFFCNNTLQVVETVEWQTFLKENSTVGNELIIKTVRKYENK